MKNTGKIILLLCLTVLVYPAAAQLMRVAILPQPTVKVTPSIQPVLGGVGIDYFRMEPNGAAGASQPAYNQVLSPADVVVKINNKLSHQTFQSLVEGDNALLLLHPLSKDRIHVEINTLSSQSQGVESVELDVLAPVVIGYNKTDADVKQAMVMFKNYGTQITPAGYFNRAMCLDIMQQNRKLTYGEDYVMTPASLRLLNKLYTSLDYTLFAPKEFKTFVNSNLISITDSGELDNGAIWNLQQVFYYQQAIAATQAINTGWKTKNYTECKTAFYNESYHLTVFNNFPYPDTLINGERWVHMMAWKNKGFTKPEEGKTPAYRRNDSIFYKSAPELFNHAFFMVQASELENWLRKNFTSPVTGRMRLMQLLGLPPNSTNDEFEEFWVRKEDMFRPGIDSSLNLGGLLANLDSSYIKSFLGYSSGSFSASVLLSKYPFTGYGYTWDWNPENKTHAGLNEFVLKENREIYISGNYTTEEFLKKIYQ